MSQTAQPAARAPLDWKALQKALVFTKLVYRKPPAVSEDAPPRKPPAPRPVPTVEEVMALALGAVPRDDEESAAPVAAAAAVAVAPAPAAAVATKKPKFDPYGEVDDRLLPWSWD